MWVALIATKRPLRYRRASAAHTQSPASHDSRSHVVTRRAGRCSAAARATRWRARLARASMARSVQEATAPPAAAEDQVPHHEQGDEPSRKPDPFEPAHATPCDAASRPCLATGAQAPSPSRRSKVSTGQKPVNAD